MCSATALTRPPAIATSRRSLRPCAGSTTVPPDIRRSYIASPSLDERRHDSRRAWAAVRRLAVYPPNRVTARKEHSWRIQRINPASMAEPIAPYTLVVRKDNVVTTAGMLGLNADGKLVGDDITSQTRQTLDQH